MKKSKFLLLFLSSIIISSFAENAYQFDPKAEFQFKAADSDGEIYAVKFDENKKIVKETMMIDLKTDQSRITIYDESGLPIETYQNEKLYVYEPYDDGLEIYTNEQYVKDKLMSDAEFLKSQGINLGFMDKMVLDNVGWLEKLSQNKKYLDIAMTCVAGVETAVSCLGVGVNPLLAIPCATGLINLIGKNYNKTNPELSGTMDLVSGKVAFMHDYIKDGKVIDTWGQVDNVINKTNTFYNERKEKMHQNAELLRAAIREENELKRKQKYEEKGELNIDKLNSWGGIITRANKKIDDLKTEQKTSYDYLTELNKQNKLNEDMVKKTMARDKEIEKEILQTKKNAEIEFNDSLKGAKTPCSWKKTDSEAHYNIQKVLFTGIRWNKYDHQPWVNLELNFSTSMKPLYVKQFDEMKKFETYMRTINYKWNDAKRKDVEGALIVSKEIRESGVLIFGMFWSNFLITPVIIFPKSSFGIDYSMQNK
ncbi:MAG: hypothetical protein PHS59_08525 [Paludibacter sp.]|nr:hypothetical protein [Paludibacter sp.]